MGMRILGVSCDYHDAAAALVIDGEIVAAVEQERLSRVKHDSSLPEDAIASCLAIAGLEPDELDVVVFHEKPLVVVGRVLAARQRKGPSAMGTFVREMPVLLRRNLLVGYRLEKALRRLGATKAPDIAYGEHHLSHASAAFLASPFPTAAILTVDGVGEWATSTVGHGLHHRVDLLEEQRFPDSLGLLYSLATVWCGFEANDGEYKLMGLAPFGEPTYVDALEELVQVDADGSFRIDAKRVGWWSTPTEKLGDLHALLGGPPRVPGSPLTRRDLDLARSVQELTERIVLAMAHHAHELTGESRLCMAGGVALNCVANGRILREGPFDEIWVQPAAGDGGSAVGAALWYWHGELGRPRRLDEQGSPGDLMHGAFLGPGFSNEEITAWLEEEGVSFRLVEDRSDLESEVAGALAEGAIVGWFQGRMEFGPRALGHRSILADPRSVTVQSDINQRVKGRESFRPFAPAVLADRAAEWFDIDAPSPYMLVTFPVARRRWVDVTDEPEDPVERVQIPRSEIPACTHVDRSARVQTVDPLQNPVLHRLLEAFDAATGCPVLLNTSFNLAGEPIVCTPADALRSARQGGLDLLVLEDVVVDLSAERPGALVGVDTTEEA